MEEQKKRNGVHKNEPEKQNHIHWEYYNKVSEMLILLRHFQSKQGKIEVDSHIVNKILAAKGIGDNPNLKSKIIKEIVEKDYSHKHWDEICEKGNYSFAGFFSFFFFSFLFYSFLFFSLFFIFILFYFY